MARCQAESNGIFALAALKPSTSALILSTTIDTLVPSKFVKSCNLTVKAAVCEGSVAPVAWPTTRLSASSELPAIEHNRYIMLRCKQ